MIKKFTLAIALSVSVFSSSSFAAETIDVTGSFQIIPELKDCKIYRLQSNGNAFGLSTFLFLTKCGNNTSTDMVGKNPTRTSYTQDSNSKIVNDNIIEINGSQYIKESNLKDSKESINFNGENYIKIK